MSHHGRLSQAARNPHYGFIPVLGRVYAEAQKFFATRTILRNGPRILRACETIDDKMTAELYAAYESEMWND